MNKGRISTANFLAEVAADSAATLVSKRIGVPFRTKRIRVFLDASADWKVNVYFFVSPDEDAPTTEPPTGTSLLAQLSQQNYVSADHGVIDFPVEVDVAQKGQYLKVYIENTDAEAPHFVCAQISVELLPSVEEKKVEE